MLRCDMDIMRYRQRRPWQRPRRVRRSRGVAVLRSPADRLKRPPEAEVVLVVPVVDRRVRCREVLHREETCALHRVEIVPCDELPGDVVPARDGVALPPLGDVRLGCGPGRGRHHAVAAERLDLVELRRVGGAGECKRTGGTELRRALHQERLDAAHPGVGRAPSCRWASPDPRTQGSRSGRTETARTVHRPVSRRSWLPPPRSRPRLPCS